MVHPWTSSSAGRATILALAAAVFSVGFAPAGQENGRSGLDCGVNSLFILLQLQGRPVSLARLEAVLPAQHPQGRSMAELSEAARSFGVRLRGVRLETRGSLRGRPAIVYLMDNAGGHFAVLRPVGTTGTMVQVLDPPTLRRSQTMTAFPA